MEHVGGEDDIAALSDGNIAVLTPVTLTILSATGAVLAQYPANYWEYLALLAVTNTPSQLLLSGHAWSALNIPQDFNGLVILATNSPETLDPAFLRRFRFVIPLRPVPPVA